MNPYDILGVPNNASDEQIRQAYKSLAQHHHPDKGGNEELFKQIKFAYEILSDPLKRREYDRTGEYTHRPSIRDETLEQLSRLFFDVLSKANIEQDDILLTLRVETRNIREHVQKDINACSDYIVRLSKVKKKIKKKNNGDNILAGIVEKQIESRNRELEMFMRRIHVCDQMIEVLEDYQYGDTIAMLIHQFENPNNVNGGPKG